MDERRLEETAPDIKFLLDTIIEQIPEPEYVEGTAQMQVASLDFSSYLADSHRRVFRGEIMTGHDILSAKGEGR